MAKPMKKYLFMLIYLLPAMVYIALTQKGWITFLPLIFFFIIVPGIELLIKPDHSNVSKELEKQMKQDRFYDWVIFLIIPVHLALLYQFLTVIKGTPMGSVEYFGRVFSMGFMLGVIGINLGHELGHRAQRKIQFLGELLLLSSLDTHFLPYHNAGHHFNVATPDDSATAKKNEILYFFWIKSHFGSYAEAWKLESKRMKKKNKSIFSLHNRMILYSIANVVLLSVIYFVFGFKVLFSFLIAASIGILLLETINYIEHYGLLRIKDEKGNYERVKHHHSWNSDHLLGRFFLFNLSRHSDHHYNGSKKYQLLRSVESSPQMPTGYPGMVLLSLLQPLWFYVMNKKLNRESMTSKAV